MHMLLDVNAQCNAQSDPLVLKPQTLRQLQVLRRRKN
jgi:hypothetical protein